LGAGFGEKKEKAMRLFEYEAKKLFCQCGIPVPQGRLVRSPQEAVEAFRELRNPAVLKSQVLAGGRGKAGGIRFCATADEAGQGAAELLNSFIQGKQADALLMEERIKIKEEHYMGITFEPRAGLPALLLSRKGGVDIEEMDPALIFSEIIDPQEGLPQFKARALAKKAGFPPSLYVKLGQIAAQLYGVFVAQEAIILEINPLVSREGGELCALDGKMDLDDDAFFRHPEWAGRPFEGTEIEARARRKNLRFVELEGDIGICGNGAGMMMTAMDLIVRKGGRPANFCEAGGAHAQAGSGRGAIEWWRDAVDLVLSNQKVTRILFNLVGGNQRGDEVARGIVEALRNKKIPAYIRLAGTNQEEGRSILAEHGFRSYETLEEAVAALIQGRD